MISSMTTAKCSSRYADGENAMTIEMTLSEAELLIALLTGAEGAFAAVNPPLVVALNDLRQWRSVLLQTYLHERIGIGTAPAINESTTRV